VLSPAAIWIATSTDAFLLLVAAVTVTVALAALRPTSARSDRLAVAAGVGFVACLLLSYGLVLVAVVPVVVAWRRRRARPLVVMAIVTVAGLGIFGLSGFWWPAGLLATRHQYDVLRVSRPYWYFVLADLSAWALVLGPALAVALVRLDGWPGGWRWWRSGTRRGDGVALLVAGGLAAVLVADLSGMSEAEVERIWLPFGAWVLLAGAALAGRRARPWLALQAASAVVLVALVTTQW
jgi:methylthioxylose transferase